MPSPLCMRIYIYILCITFFLCSSFRGSCIRINPWRVEISLEFILYIVMYYLTYNGGVRTCVLSLPCIFLHWFGTLNTYVKDPFFSPRFWRVCFYSYLWIFTLDDQFACIIWTKTLFIGRINESWSWLG